MGFWDAWFSGLLMSLALFYWYRASEHLKNHIFFFIHTCIVLDCFIPLSPANDNLSQLTYQKPRDKTNRRAGPGGGGYFLEKTYWGCAA